MALQPGIYQNLVQPNPVCDHQRASAPCTVMEFLIKLFNENNSSYTQHKHTLPSLYTCTFPLQHSGGPAVSESPANDLPPKYEDLLVEQQGAGSGVANQSAAAGPSNAPTASSSSTGGAAAAAVRGMKSTGMHYIHKNLPRLCEYGVKIHPMSHSHKM